MGDGDQISLPSGEALAVFDEVKGVRRTADREE
jgi:hypothetical protein